MAEITRPRFTGVSGQREDDQVPNRTEIQQFMEEARRQIEERKSRLLVENAAVAPDAAPMAGPQMDPKARLAELKARLQVRTANLPILNATAADQAVGRPAPLILDAEGRTVDRSGKAVQLVQRTPTLKANIRAQRKEQVVRVVKDKPVKEDEEVGGKFADFRVPVSHACHVI